MSLYPRNSYPYLLLSVSVCLSDDYIAITSTRSDVFELGIRVFGCLTISINFVMFVNKREVIIGGNLADLSFSISFFYRYLFCFVRTGAAYLNCRACVPLM